MKKESEKRACDEPAPLKKARLEDSTPSVKKDEESNESAVQERDIEEEPMTLEDIMEKLESSSVMREKQRRNHVNAMHKRHSEEFEALKQKYSNAEDADKLAEELKTMKRAHDSDRKDVEETDADCERQLGYTRRQMHQMLHIDYCETCFKVLDTGVRTFQFGHLTPLAPQYCEDCADDAPEDWESTFASTL